MNIFSVFQQRWQWKDFGEFEDWLDRKGQEIAGDGLCCPKSIQKAIKLDYGLDWPLDAIKHDIMTKVTKSAKSYLHFHDMIEHKVVTSMYDYLEKGQFTDSIVDVVVPATAQAL